MKHQSSWASCLVELWLASPAAEASLAPADLITLRQASVGVQGSTSGLAASTHWDLKGCSPARISRSAVNAGYSLLVKWATSGVKIVSMLFSMHIAGKPHIDQPEGHGSNTLTSTGPQSHCSESSHVHPPHGQAVAQKPSLGNKYFRGRGDHIKTKDPTFWNQKTMEVPEAMLF